MYKKEAETEIDLIELLKTLWEKAWIIVISAVIMAGVFFSWTYFMIQPRYEADIMVYVNNVSVSLGNVGVSISPSDLSVSQKLVDTYAVILKSRMALNEIIEEADIDLNVNELSSRISAGSVNSTEVFKIVVWDYNPRQAEKIANTIARILPDKIASIIDGSSVKIVDTAVVPSIRSSPSYSRNTILGFVLGAAIAAALILLKKFSDPYIKSEEYITQTFGIPLLAVIPRVGGKSDKNQYYYRKN